MMGTNELRTQTSEVLETSEVSDGFKQTEIGPIPVDWEVVRLGEVASLTMGQSPPSSTYNTDGDGLPFLQGKAEFGETYPTPIKWCSQPKKVAGRGSVLISVRAPVGDVNVARDDYCIGRGLAAINGGQSLDNWFLFYLLILEKRRLEDKGTGSTFKSINKGVLQSFSVPLPSLPEQRRIAHVLSTIQRAIAGQDDLIAAAREVKRSLMQRLFTYGSSPEPASTKETEIGEVPGHWEIVHMLSAVDRKIEAEEQRKAALQALFKTMLHQLMTGQVRV
jgi:type I restriction enzyme S subunit